MVRPVVPEPWVLANRLAPLAGALRIVSRGLNLADPWLALATRLWLAQSFLAVQVVMVMGGERFGGREGDTWSTGILARLADGGFGHFVQAVCPLLLAAGLLTRPAALALLIQAAVLTPPGIDPRHGFWLVLLATVLVRGAGVLSVDALVGGGLLNSSVPGTRSVQAFYRGLSRYGTAPLWLGLRVVVATAVVVPQGGMLMHGGPMSAMLPRSPAGFAALPDVVALAAAALLVSGFAVRPLALALLVLAPAGTTDFWMVGFSWALLLAHLATNGGGMLALDRTLSTVLATIERVPREDAHHVVVVGGGFGGHALARGLAGSPCRVTLIDRHNYNLFQPLLYQVATAGLSPGDIATPIRSLLREQRNARVVLGTVEGVDARAKAVRLADRTIPYDTLVLATGARHSYFGRDAWSAVAPGLKTVEDATEMRRRLLVAFETAESTDDPCERRAWLTFVVVGGGPTGVELAGAIAELARFGLDREFRHIDPASARVVLVQSADRLLPAFHERSSREALHALRRLGVEVLLGSKAEEIDGSGIVAANGTIAARTVCWAAGVEASPAARWLGAEADRAGRVRVGPDLRVPGVDDVFAIGDTCASDGWNGRPVPGLAPAAKQAGAYVAGVIRAGLAGRAPPPPFRYRHAGNLATIGRKAAVVEFGSLRLRGAGAWWFWGAAHVAFLIDGRSRVGVVVEWMWDYLTARKGTRLIVGNRPIAFTAN